MKLDIAGVGLYAGQKLQSPTEKDAAPASFSAVLSAAKNDYGTQKIQQGNNGEWNWTESSDGISHAIGPDGREWRRIEFDRVLTPEDKLLTGWPSLNDSKAQEIAMFIAMDRADGYLKGPVTKDYLLGNDAQGLVGLAERSPNLSRSDLNGVLKHLML